MASTPTYMGNVCVARASVSTANTNRDGTGTLVTPTWGGSGGAGAPITDWQLLRLVVSETADLANSTVTVFTTDGTTVLFLTDIVLGDPAAASATVTGLIGETIFTDYKFPAAWDLRFAITAAPTSGVCVVTAFCERA